MKTKKVLNKIDNCNKHGNEGQLGKHNDDECYTPEDFVKTELEYWAALNKFEGKSVISPCDFDIIDPDNQQTQEFFARYGISLSAGEYLYAMKVSFDDRSWPDKVVLSFNDVQHVSQTESEQVRLFNLEKDELPGTRQVVLNTIEEIRDFFKSSIKCQFARYFLQNSARLKLKSYTASGYEPYTGKGIPFQKVDFSKYDICVTNPPFSIYKEFLACILGKCDFCCVAPLLNRSSANQGEAMMEGKLFLGQTRDASVPFERFELENGQLISKGQKKVCCDYITSWPEAQLEVNARHYCPNVKYEDYKEDYITLPNLKMKDDPRPVIKVPVQFPGDYDGWMFGSIGHLDKLDQERYEWYMPLAVKYFNSNEAKNNPFDCKLSAGGGVAWIDNSLACSNGKKGFGGIVFRKKKK